MINNLGREVLYGFEDYRLITMPHAVLEAVTLGSWSMHYYSYSTNTILVDQNIIPSKYYSIDCDRAVTVEENKKVLDTAKKVYVHPSCKLSRTLVATKYSKCLNPWMADAVVIPSKEYHVYGDGNYGLFINEKAKYIIEISEPSFYDVKILESLNQGTVLRNIVQALNLSEMQEYVDYNIEEALNSELFYFGSLYNISRDNDCIGDIVTGALPLDKLVTQETIMKSLSNEDNKVTYEGLISISEMLESSDDDTVGAGLRALSMMDYINYPNSVQYIFKRISSNYYYNKATNSTSVKFMFKTLFGSKKRAYYNNYRNNIKEDDYELFKKLVCHFEKTDESQILKFIMDYPFMSVNGDGFVSPMFTQSA